MSPGSGIAVFGGTFDPIHQGHLAVAKDVKARLGFQEVVFVPAGDPWLKADREVTAAEHRLEMVRLAVDGNPGFGVSTIEIDRPGPSYTVDTMEQLRRELGPGARLAFVLGADALAGLDAWKEPQRLIQLCCLVAFARPGFPLPALEPLEAAIPGLSRRVTFVEVSQVDVSASDIRRRVAKGLPIRGMVPEAVERYILEHRLYKGPLGATGA
ncbi:MAG: nicotinic acid mononucleotide adenylyltransferase [Chloroflexi bacterium]|nr:MAG: nicotinic acid mononucleotide adenylyltransferase [Chloroflexota bacterium]